MTSESPAPVLQHIQSRAKIPQISGEAFFNRGHELFMIVCAVRLSVCFINFSAGFVSSCLFAQARRSSVIETEAGDVVVACGVLHIVMAMMTLHREGPLKDVMLLDNTMVFQATIHDVQ